MSTLAVILADCPAPRGVDADLARPRLAALERVLARGTLQALPGGWRPWLARQLAAAGTPGGRGAGPARWAAAAPAGLAAASLAAAGRGEVVTAWHYWFATPVHYFAGIRSVHLHPAGLLWLSAAEQEALAASFAAVFGDLTLRLLPTGRRELLLGGGVSVVGAEGVHSTEPSRWLGADPGPGLPAGAGAAKLRRLGAEIEMWLYEHPLNRARSARGELPVTALWLWGGGPAFDAAAPIPAPTSAPTPPPAPASPAERPAVRIPAGGPAAALVYAQDTFAEALAGGYGVAARPLPDALDHAVSDTAAAFVVLPTATAEPLAALQAANERWLAPALRRLGRGSLRELQLLAGSSCWRLTRARSWRAWRRDVAWWLALGADEDEDPT